MTRCKLLRTFIGSSLLISVAIFFASAGYAQDKSKGDSDALNQLYAGARQEGVVVIWGPTDAVIYQRAQAALDKQYPGIKIEHFESIPEPLVQRIIAESQAGKPAAVDIIQSGSLRALRPLIDRDMLAVYPGWEKDFGLDAVYAGQRFVGAYNLTLPIAYNTKMVTAQEAPKTWENLADAKWKGRKIIIEARLVPFAMLGTEWGKAKATELTKRILGQQPLIVQGGTTVANALAGGQVSLAVGTYAYTIERLKKQGAAVDWVENGGSELGAELLLDSPLGRFIARRSSEWWPGLASELFFRPENVDLLEDGIAGGLNRGAGIVERATFLGNSADVVVRCGDIAIRVRSLPGRTPSVGQLVRFSVAAQSCIVFPASAG